MSRYPNLFIVGAPKSGTTAMAKYLNSHPDIFAPAQKEFWFFGNDLKRYKAGPTDVQYLEWFTKWNNEIYALDASPFYLYSMSAPSEIKDKVKNPKIIIMLRNPTDLVHSMYHQNCFVGAEDKDSFQKAWDLEEVRLKGSAIPIKCKLEMSIRYKTIGQFSLYVKNYIDHLGKDNVHVIFYDDFKIDAKKCFEHLLHFLNLNTVYPENFEVVNASKKARVPGVTDFFTHPPAWMGSLGSVFISKENRRKIRDFVIKKNTKPTKNPELSNGMTSQLNEYFRADIVRLETLLGKDLGSWYND